MAEPERQLKCLLVPMSGPGLLVPNVLVAEIVTQQAVVEHEGGADWLLGTGSWRGTEIPLIAFERLAGLVDGVPDAAGRYVVLYSLDPGHTPDFYGIRIEALPRSETVDGERLQSRGRSADDSPVIAARAHLGDRECMVPDLDALVRAIRTQIT